MPRFRWIVPLVICSPLLSERVRAEELPRIRVLNPAERVRPMAMEVPSMAFAERAPFALTHDGRVQYLIGTNRTDVFGLRAGRNVLEDADALDPGTRFRPVYGEIRRHFPEHYMPPGELENKYWRWIYYGINSAHVIRHPKTGEPCVVGITHGENKNFRAAPRGGHPEYWYENTVLPPSARPYQPYEYHSGGKVPKNQAGKVRETYSGFVGLIWYSLTEEEPLVHDLGPIVWPAACLP